MGQLIYTLGGLSFNRTSPIEIEMANFYKVSL